MRQPFIKEPLPALRAWSLLLTHRPSPVVSRALFSQTKHRPSHEVARHTVWCAQTFRLLTGQLNPAVSSPCSTSLMHVVFLFSVCVFFTSPTGKTALFYGNLSLTRNFSSRLKSLSIPEAPDPSEFQSSGMKRPILEKNCGLRKQHCGFFTTVVNESPHVVPKRAVTSIWHITN